MQTIPSGYIEAFSKLVKARYETEAAVSELKVAMSFLKKELQFHRYIKCCFSMELRRVYQLIHMLCFY